MTERVATEWQERLRVLLAEGETSTVDIKRELHVDGVREKGEFIRDVLGLATTKASGHERYLLVGFDDETSEFLTSVDAAITRERLEQIVNAYTDPKPELDWVTVPVSDGVAGVVIVRVILQGALPSGQGHLEADARRGLRAPRHAYRGADRA